MLTDFWDYCASCKSYVVSFLSILLFLFKKFQKSFHDFTKFYLPSFDIIFNKNIINLKNLSNVIKRGEAYENLIIFK